LDAFVRYLRDIDEALSRTARTGSAATSVNPNKKPALLSGNALREAVETNRNRAAAFIHWQRRNNVVRPDDIIAVLTGLGWIVNFGILSEGLYRAWSYVTPGDGNGAPAVPPARIGAGLVDLGAECAAIACLDPAGKARAIARVEWEIGIGPLHPFYDGCGRVSRYFSALLCFWHEAPLRIHPSRDVYMAAATAGEGAFIDYWVAAPLKEF
jgi:hypothetical protein